VKFFLKISLEKRDTIILETNSKDSPGKTEIMCNCREKFRGSEHFFWDYILNTRRANALRVDHKKIQKDPFFPFF